MAKAIRIVITPKWRQVDSRDPSGVLKPFRFPIKRHTPVFFANGSTADCCDAVVCGKAGQEIPGAAHKMQNNHKLEK